MRILVTNDDGIMAPGLLALRRALADLGDTVVVAPTVPQSAVGHSITLTDPIRVHRVDLADGLVGYGVEGSPADCVKLALLELLDEPVDLVASGVNLGANVGINVLYSGTVAAAVEGAFFGVPAVAVSIEDTDAPDYDGAARIARRLIDQWLGRNARKALLLNVNVPDLTSGPPRGVCVVGQSLKGWREGWERRRDPRGRMYYWMVGDPQREEEGTDSDTAALAARYVTVTPLRFDLTDPDGLGEVEQWNLHL